MKKKLDRWRRAVKRHWQKVEPTDQEMCGVLSVDFDQSTSARDLIRQTRRKSSAFNQHGTHIDGSSSIDCAGGNGRVTYATL